MPRLPDIIREGLLSIFDSWTADRLMTDRPELVETVAIAIGEARLRARMSLTPLAALAWSRLIAAEVADADSFGMPHPAFDLDADPGHGSGAGCARCSDLETKEPT
jgi:hypothetical protein